MNVIAEFDRNDQELAQEYEAVRQANAAARQQALNDIAARATQSKASQERKRREAAQAQAEQGYKALASQLPAQLAALAATIESERDQLQQALDLAATASRWQYNQPGRVVELIKQFAAEAAPFAAMTSSEQEFVRQLHETVTGATSGLESSWQLRVESNLAKALRIFGGSWVQHMIGDLRANAINDGLKAAKATGGK